MTVINGINAKTIQNMQLDAGVILLGDMADPESANIQSEITRLNVGATKGATTFSAIPEIRNIFDGIDGVRGDIKDGNVIDKWEVTLKMTVTEITKNNLEMALGCSTYSAGGQKYETIEPKDVISSSDYKTVNWIGTMAGSAEPIIITLKNCLNVSGLTITAEDKNTGTVEIELKAHINLENTEKQFKIYLPKQHRVMAASEVAEIKEKFEIESEE